MSSGPADPADLLAKQARSLVERLRLWTPQRWAASPGEAAPQFATRGDVIHHLAAAYVVAAGETDTPLPRLDSDLALPDQLAVTAADLARSGAADLAAVAHLLAHRRDLLGEDVPAGLLAQLGDVPVRCPRTEEATS